MDTWLQHGDHTLGARGFPVAVWDGAELAQRAMIRLCVPRGSFPLDSTLGSSLAELGRVPRGQQDIQALEVVRQALLPIAGLQVLAVRCTPAHGSLRLQIDLDVGGTPQTLEVETI